MTRHEVECCQPARRPLRHLSPHAYTTRRLVIGPIIIYTIILLISVSLSVVLIWGLYRPSSEPIALRNVLKRSTRHTVHIIRFWHFSSAVIITKNAKKCVCAFNPVGAATSNKTHRERRMRKVL